MTKITGIRFKRAGKVYYFDPGDLELAVGQKAIVETVRGIEMGDVVISSKMVEDDAVLQPLKRIMRAATADDLRHAEDNKAREPKALETCHEKIRAHNLPMKLVGAEFTFDNSKIIFYFTAEGRVDFRELVKDLASVFKMRIELRQIGVRDEAKLVGGLGPCGLPMCCTTWLGDFDPVSIKMAKEQNLSLNPAKISGICGRLMCCLKYESGMYDEARPEPERRPFRAPAPPVTDVPCPGQAECIGCDELVPKEDTRPEDEEGILVAEAEEAPHAEGPSRRPFTKAATTEGAGFPGILSKEEAARQGGVITARGQGSQPSAEGLSRWGNQGRGKPNKGGWAGQSGPRAQVHGAPGAEGGTSTPAGDGPPSRAEHRKTAPDKRFDKKGRREGDGRPDWDDFQSRQKPEAPGPTASDASAQGAQVEGKRADAGPDRRFKKGRRGHGHRRPQGGPEPGGNPKGQ